VLESPLAAIAEYERANLIPEGSINRAVAAAGDGSAWARHERGELDFAAFCEEWEAELAEVDLVVDAAELMARIELTIRARPEMLDIIRSLRRAGIKVAALTNSWPSLGDNGVEAEFDLVVHSWRERLRKPEPEIYRLTLSRLGIEAKQAVFLDDIGGNLRVARQMGLTTIKVDDPADAIGNLREIFPDL